MNEEFYNQDDNRDEQNSVQEDRTEKLYADVNEESIKSVYADTDDKEPERIYTGIFDSEPESVYSDRNNNDSENVYSNRDTSEPEVVYAGMFDSKPESSYGSMDTEESDSMDAHAYDIPHIPPVTRVQAVNEKSPRKKTGFFKKAVALVLSAAVFGSVAGSVMIGMNYASEKAGFTGNKAAQIPTIAVDNVTNAESGSTVTSGNTSVAAIAEKVLPSVVAITNTQVYENYYNDAWSYFFGRGGMQDTPEYESSCGSGIIVGQNDSELFIVTNNHVIEDASELTITFADDSTAEAQIRGTSATNDLAVVSVQTKDLSGDTMAAIAVAAIGDSSSVKVGEGVVAIGNAMGFGQSVTVGYISALDREVTTSDNVTRKLLQTDAAINPGNSGGALVNMKGEIIGINSAKYSDTDVEGIGYAIPISSVTDIINDLIEKEPRTQVAEDEKGLLGIYGKAVEENNDYGMPQGIYVVTIMEGSGAAQSELKENDIIIALDGENITTYQQLQEMIAYYKGGEKVELTIYRLVNGKYEEQKISVTLSYAKDFQNNQSDRDSQNSRNPWGR